MISPAQATRLLSLIGLLEEAPLEVPVAQQYAVLGMLTSVSEEDKANLVVKMREALKEMEQTVNLYEGA